jgi:hypothetical protein
MMDNRRIDILNPHQPYLFKLHYDFNWEILKPICDEFLNDETNKTIPILKNGKNCTNEYGCDRLYNGDTVFVEGINEPYNVTMYESDTIKYLPLL